MELGIRGRTALVTGASEGIGRAAAIRFAEEGTDVVLVARSPERLADVSSDVARRGVAAHAVTADLSTRSGVASCVSAVTDLGCTIDILVNNVGGMGRPRLPLHLSEEDWSEVLELNLMSSVRLCHALVPAMLERRWGRIVHIASIGAREPGPGVAHYAAAKAAVLAFSKSLSQAHGDCNVLSNCVVPGVTQSRALMNQAAGYASAHQLSTEEALEQIAGFRPAALGRIAEAEEIAAAIVFLASEAASFVTGATLSVDGGTLLGLW